MSAIFTTSWDDGHPLDLRVAELLARYGLPGTFYVPRRGPAEVMDRASVRELSAGFEVGAHTMTHGNLLAMSDVQAHSELVDSKRYIEDLTGRECVSFAPPGGQFRRVHVAMAASAGFRGLRTVELLNLGRPTNHSGLAVIPTTLQVFPHSPYAYLRNAAKRGRLENVSTFLAHARGAGLPLAARGLVAAAIERGGVFHLWGHSWELDALGMWETLEQIFSIMRDERGRFCGATNQDLCEEVLRNESVANTVADPELS